MRTSNVGSPSPAAAREPRMRERRSVDHDTPEHGIRCGGERISLRIRQLLEPRGICTWVDLAIEQAMLIII